MSTISSAFSAISNSMAATRWRVAAEEAFSLDAVKQAGNGTGFDPDKDARAPSTKPDAASGEETDASGLNNKEQQQLRELQQRDREVRQHEQAHLAAAGGLAASAPTYSFQRGPDGQLYAVGGEVQIDTSPGRTPEETIRRAEAISAAALAPANPSAQDRAVAAQAQQMRLQAVIEQQTARTEETDSLNPVAARDTKETTETSAAVSAAGTVAATALIPLGETVTPQSSTPVRVMESTGVSRNTAYSRSQLVQDALSMYRQVRAIDRTDANETRPPLAVA